MYSMSLVFGFKFFLKEKNEKFNLKYLVTGGLPKNEGGCHALSWRPGEALQF